MKVLFIRHGQTAKNTIGAVHKADDETLLDIVGQDQARKLAHACLRAGVNLVMCSPEARASETSDAIVQATTAKKIIVQELRERDWGDWSDKPWSEIKSELEEMPLEQRYEFIPPHGESWRQMDERLAVALAAIRSHHDSVVAVVTHGGCLRALLPILDNAPKESSFQYDLDNASITEYEIEGQKARRIRLNDTAHLAG